MSQPVTRAVFDAILRLVPVLIVLAIWQAVASIHRVDSSFFPPPLAVARALGDLLAGHEIRDNLGVTLFRALVGLALATLSGVWFGISMARSWVFNAIASPLVGATYSLPKTAIVPLLILWFGIGSTMAILAVYLTCLLPIIVQTYHGVRATPPVVVWSARSLGADERKMLWQIFLPNALPDILTGIRIALGFSFVVAISAEMIASTRGIGRLIFMYGENGSYDYMFAAVVSVVIAAFVADRALLYVSARYLRWHESQVAAEIGAAG